MTSSLRNKCRWAFKFIVLLSLSISLIPAQSIGAADPPVTIFLPLIMKPVPGIRGRVTFNGASAVGEQILLCHQVNPSYFDCFWDTTVDSNGYYTFPSSSLTPGWIYQVYFRSDAINFGDPSTDDGKLYYWWTPLLAPYVADSSVVMATFDIADAPLVSPTTGSTISLPYTFQWTKRAASPTDSYKVYIYEPGTQNSFTSAPLGYTDSYQLESLPVGFSPDPACRWVLWIYGPDGGSGRSGLRVDSITISDGSSSLDGVTSGMEYIQINVNGKVYLTERYP